MDPIPPHEAVRIAREHVALNYPVPPQVAGVLIVEIEKLWGRTKDWDALTTLLAKERDEHQARTALREASQT